MPSTPLDFQKREPPNDLKDVVRFLYRIDAPEERGAFQNHPQGAVDVCLVVRGEVRFANRRKSVTVTRQGGVVVPLQTGPFRFAFGPGTVVVGAAFQPTGLSRFIPIPESDLVDSCLDLDEVPLPQLDPLREHLDAAWAQRGLSSWLRDHRREREPSPLLTRFLSALPSLRDRTVREMARELGASKRSLERALKSELGLTPKRALRLARFQRAVRLLRSGSTRLAEVALEAGYFDQSHFSNEFRAFSGQTPSRFLRRREPLADAFDGARLSTGGR